MEFTISVSPWDRGAYTTNKNARSKIIPSTPLTCFHWRQSVTHKFSLGRVVLPLASQSDSASSQWAEISSTQRHSGPHRRVVWKGWDCHVSVSTGCLLPPYSSTPCFPWAVRSLIITDREPPCKGLENNKNALLCSSSTFQRNSPPALCNTLFSVDLFFQQYFLLLVQNKIQLGNNMVQYNLKTPVLALHPDNPFSDPFDRF